MDSTLLAVLALIAVALIFDFINGFHDAANSIATIVSTRVSHPGRPSSGRPPSIFSPRSGLARPSRGRSVEA